MPVVPEWSPKPPQWSKDELNLLPSHLDDLPLTTLQTVIEKSDAFPQNFPIDAGRCKTLKTYIDESILERNANSAYPVIHENILHLCAKYVLYKRQYGNSIEKEVYKDLNVLQLIDRFLTKRAFMFEGVDDCYTLLNGENGNGVWEIVGTPEEKKPLVLEKCLSYEEIKLSAFLSISSYTHFVNIGDECNYGSYNAKRGGIEDEGVIIGVVGPRLVKPEVMEYQELIITAKQNTKENGYGKTKKTNIHQLFANFYEEDSLEFKDLKKRKKLPSNVQRYSRLKKGEFLDNFVYYKRLLFSIDTLFIEANQRALEKNTTAYLHVVGIGLDRFTMRSECQNKIFVDSCGERIKVLGKHLHNISDICFASINQDSCLDFQHGDTIPIEGHPLKGIKIHISTKEPHSRLTGRDQGKLLVVSYAYDGNALPGNKFWHRFLTHSNDAIAASSTQISELHNPFINPRVCANNLRVVVRGKVVHIKEYAESTRKRVEKKFS